MFCLSVAGQATKQKTGRESAETAWEGNMKLFEGETAVVTGAASNIGRAIAVALAAEGAHVLAADINEDGLASVADDIRASGGSVETKTCDLSGANGWRDLSDAVLALKPQMFVHSASPARKETDRVGTVTEETFDAMVNTNLRSGFLLSRAVAEQMRDAGTKGRIVMVTSLHAHTPRNLPHYSASKAGMTMLVKEMAREYGAAGIRVNAIAPGAIPGGGFNLGEGMRALAEKVPMKRLGRADEIAGMTVALLADRFASYVTGTTIAVDGGIDLYNWIEF
jgi:3-oxoacyl-[acyl-carrier protein] reductase